MLKKANIQTILVSTTENGEDLIRTESVGGCLIEENGIMLRYTEKENSGTATLLLTEGLADLKRHGHTESRMTFVEGKLLPCLYTTPNGGVYFLGVNSSTLKNVNPSLRQLVNLKIKCQNFQNGF